MSFKTDMGDQFTSRNFPEILFFGEILVFLISTCKYKETAQMALESLALSETALVKHSVAGRSLQY